MELVELVRFDWKHICDSEPYSRMAKTIWEWTKGLFGYVLKWHHMQHNRSDDMSVHAD